MKWNAPTWARSKTGTLFVGLVVLVGYAGADTPPASPTVDAPPYDNHATFDAKVEEYHREYSEFLGKRKALWQGYMGTVVTPTFASMSDADRKRMEDISAAADDCGDEPEGSSSAYDEYQECRGGLFDKVMAAMGYETFAEYKERNGGDPVPPTYPVYKLEPSPPTADEIAYEKAKQECADKGGSWVVKGHGDGVDNYFNWMRCWQHDPDEPRPPPEDPFWEQEPLLPYDVVVTHDQRSNQVLQFDRTSLDDLTSDR